MASWPELSGALRKSFLVEADDEDLLMLVLTEGQERQTVFVQLHEGTHGRSWLRVEAGFGDLATRYLAMGIDYVGMVENLGVGLGRVGDVVTIRWTGFLDGISELDVTLMVSSIAGHAKSLADSLRAHS